MSIALPGLEVAPKSGNERFTADGKRLSYTALDFWRWAASDMVSNALRGALAEFIVGMALGATMETRREWDACDLCTPEGIKVEVKSSAYCQTWPQKKFSTLSFKIPPTKGWDAKTNEYSQVKKRWSDVYVFCVLKHKDKQSIDPMNLEQWDFYVVPTPEIDKRLGSQKTVGLGRIRSLKHLHVGYWGVRDAVGWAASLPQLSRTRNL